MRVASFIFTFFCFFAGNSYAEKLKTVSEFDLKKYVGTWHQVAVVPAFFQRDCITNTKAEYSLLENGFIKVVNSCETSSGDIKASQGRARINPKFNDPAKLEVTFVKIFGWVWMFGGDYWVSYIDADYSSVIVAHPKYEYGWVLSRNPSFTDEEYKDIEKRLVELGYDQCQFELSSSDERVFPEKTLLCQL